VHERHHPRARGDGALERLEVGIESRVRVDLLDLADAVAEALAPGLPGLIVGGVVVREDQHLVARAEVEATRDPVVGLAGVTGEKDLLGGGSQVAGDQLASLLPGLEHLASVGGEWLAVQPFLVRSKRLQDAGRCGAKVGGIQHRDPGRHQELRPHRVPVHGSPAQGAGRQRRWPDRPKGGMPEQRGRAADGEQTRELAAIHLRGLPWRTLTDRAAHAGAGSYPSRGPVAMGRKAMRIAAAAQEAPGSPLRRGRLAIHCAHRRGLCAATPDSITDICLL